MDDVVERVDVEPQDVVPGVGDEPPNPVIANPTTPTPT